MATHPVVSHCVMEAKNTAAAQPLNLFFNPMTEQLGERITESEKNLPDSTQQTQPPNLHLLSLVNGRLDKLSPVPTVSPWTHCIPMDPCIPMYPHMDSCIPIDPLYPHGPMYSHVSPWTHCIPMYPCILHYPVYQRLAFTLHHYSPSFSSYPSAREHSPSLMKGQWQKKIKKSHSKSCFVKNEQNNSMRLGNMWLFSPKT